MSFDTFSRGDLIMKGAVLAEVIDGTAGVANGAGLVKTLRRGVAGYHKGSLEATIGFNQAVIKTGMKEDFITAVVKQRVVKVMAVLADDLAIEVEGIMANVSFKFGENSMVTGDFSVHGRVSVV